MASAMTHRPQPCGLQPTNWIEVRGHTTDLCHLAHECHRATWAPGMPAPTGPPSRRLTHCAGLVLVGQLLGLPGGVNVILHLGQGLQELAGPQGRQSAAPGLAGERESVRADLQFLEVVESTLTSDRDELVAKAEMAKSELFVMTQSKTRSVHTIDLNMKSAYPRKRARCVPPGTTARL